MKILATRKARDSVTQCYARATADDYWSLSDPFALNQTDVHIGPMALDFK